MRQGSWATRGDRRAALSRPLPVIVVLVLLVGCGTEDVDEPQSEEPTVVPTTVVPTATTFVAHDVGGLWVVEPADTTSVWPLQIPPGGTIEGDALTIEWAVDEPEWVARGSREIVVGTIVAWDGAETPVVDGELGGLTPEEFLDGWVDVPVRVRVDSVVAGEPFVPGDEFEFTAGGYVRDGRLYEVDVLPIPRIGEQYLLFLRPAFDGDPSTVVRLNRVRGGEIPADRASADGLLDPATWDGVLGVDLAES